MTEQILFDVQAGVATITLNRPDRLNAFTTQMTAELLAALKTCARDDAIRCIILTGAGRGFCAGQDLSEIEALTGSVSDHLRHGFNQVVLSMRGLEKPIIARLNGAVAGAGLGAALAADLRIAADTAKFASAFLGIGLVPDTGMSWLLYHLAGPARAFELIATGRRLDAAEALAFGLVNQVVPAAELDARVAELAQALAQAPTRGIGLSKRLLNRVAHLSLAEALEYEAQVQDIAIATADHREGVAAFLQKRPPHFQGR